jgi:lysophospholipase L1-like esterase
MADQTPSDRAADVPDCKIFVILRISSQPGKTLVSRRKPSFPMLTTAFRFTRLSWTTLGLCGAFLAAVPVARAADGPTPFPDAKDESAWPGHGPIRVFPWMVDNRAYFWTRRGSDQGAIVFVGDSLTGNWKLSDMKAALPDLVVANRGIGGDVSRGVLFRLKEDVLDLNPRALVLLIGTNDLSARADPQVVAENISLILEQAREFNQDLPLILCLLPPRAADNAPIKASELTDLNERLTALAEKFRNLAVLDLYSALSTTDGTPDPRFFKEDLLHLDAAGYEKWAEILKPALVSAGVK